MMSLLGLWACSSAEMSIAPQADRATSDSGYYYGDDADSEAGDYGGASEEPETDDGLGSETEETAPLLLPATTNAYVFVANPDRNTVTRIEVSTLNVLTADVGVNPILVETSSDYRVAVTFNEGSDSLSVIDAETLAVQDIEIRNNLNMMQMSPDGNWVVCYHDLNGENGGVGQGGAISYNAISIVNLDTLEHVEAMAGAFPKDVQFSADSTMAVVISDDYLSVIDFTQNPPSLRRIAIAEDLVNPPLAEEVLLDPMGRYAIVRQYGVDELVLVDLQGTSDVVSMLEVGANPTDMDVSPDGSQAMVVARVAKELWIYDLQDPTLAPMVLALPESDVFGSLLLSENGSHGVLYSTASGQSRIGVWDRATQEVTVRGTIKPVSAVDMSPDSQTTILFHPRENGDIDSSSYFYNRYGVSLMDMDDLFTSSYQLSAEPDAFASTPDGRYGLFTMKDRPYIEILDYATFVPDEIQLPSIPLHLGALPDTNTIFISQEHDLGRISFFTPEEDILQTITGFELNAVVE